MTITPWSWIVGVAGGTYGAAAPTIDDDPYPRAPRIILEPDGPLRLRRRQALEQVWTNEA